MSQIAKYVTGALVALLLTAWQGVALGTSVNPEPNQSRSIVVKYADLDLTRPEDVKVLYLRIHRAAARACGERSITGSNLPLPSWSSCVAQAVDAAVTQLDRPALSAYHHEHASDAAPKG